MPPADWYVTVEKPCPECGGEKRPCNSCAGTGRVLTKMSMPDFKKLVNDEE